MKTTLVCDGTPVTPENKGGYGCAVEAFATMLGCTGELHQQLEDDANTQPDLSLLPNGNGWVVVMSDDYDALWLCVNGNAQLVGKMSMSSRGHWYAVAYDVRNSVYYCSEGANAECVFEPWTPMENQAVGATFFMR